MWFKNARLYDLKLDDHVKNCFSNEMQLEKLLQDHAFTPCQATQLQSSGFAPLYGNKSDLFVFEYNKNFFFKFVEETKLLPASVINSQLEDVIIEKETQLNRELRQNEKQQLKTALINQLLPKAFTQKRETIIWVNVDKGFCAVSVSSAKRAENVIAHIREALMGSFPCKSFSPRCVIEDRMTTWIKGDNIPQNFELGNDVVFKSADDEGGVVRISKEDLTKDEVIGHIKAGKIVTDIQINYDDMISFVLSCDLSVKRISVFDQYVEKNLPERTNDVILDLQSILILQADYLTILSNTIVEIFNCEKA